MRGLLFSLPRLAPESKAIKKAPFGTCFRRTSHPRGPLPHATDAPHYYDKLVHEMCSDELMREVMGAWGCGCQGGKCASAKLTAWAAL